MKRNFKKDVEKRILVRKTMQMLRSRIASLEKQKDSYLSSAKRAKQQGLSAQVKLAISGLKMTLSQLKHAQEMLLNFEIMSQMRDMTAMTQDFISGMSALSKDMARLTDLKEFAKVQEEFAVAMDAAQEQRERVDTFLDLSQDAFANGSTSSGEEYSDEEIMRLVDGMASADTDADGDEIDRELAALRAKLGDNK